MTVYRFHDGFWGHPDGVQYAYVGLRAGHRIRVARPSMINYGLKTGRRAVVDLDRQVFGTYD